MLLDDIDEIVESIELGNGLNAKAIRIIECLRMEPLTECFNSQYIQSPVADQIRKCHYNEFDSTTEEGKNFRLNLIAMAITQPEDMRP